MNLRSIGFSLMVAHISFASGAAAQPAAPAVTPTSGATVRRDAREVVPEALIGIWKVNFAASKYASNPPKAHLRVFQYTEDGKLLVTFLSIGANGAQSSGHWAVYVDGSPGVEYHTNWGSIPYNVVTFTKVDERNFNLTVTRFGVLDISGTYNLSVDGKTLTYAYKSANGTQTTVVYNKWEG